MFSYFNSNTYEGLPSTNPETNTDQCNSSIYTYKALIFSTLPWSLEVCVRRFLTSRRFKYHKLTLISIAFGIIFLGGLLLNFIWRSSLFEYNRHSQLDRLVTWESRADAVRNVFKESYQSYENFAFPHDELKPLTNAYVDNFNGWGLTAIDSLDTMILMDLQDEFARALELVEDLSFKDPERADFYIPFFETTIRYLGGLLSAYALSGENILLAKADELGEALLPVFNTNSGFPAWGVNPVKQKSIVKGSVLAEIASCQLEFQYLAHVTGKKKYYNVANRINKNLYNASLTNHAITEGLLPLRFNLDSGATVDRSISMGAMGDSGHEYLLKQYLLTNGTDTELLQMYLHTAEKSLEHLLYLSPVHKTLYTSGVKLTPHFSENKTVNTFTRIPDRTFQHLACFFPGLLALGVRTLSSHMSTETKYKQLTAAEGLAQACYLMYSNEPTGLGPDVVKFYGPYEISSSPDKVMTIGEYDGNYRWSPKYDNWVSRGRIGNAPGLGLLEMTNKSWQRRFFSIFTRNILKGKDYDVTGKSYLLRPETIESFYILWRVTGDNLWRERGWEVFKAIGKSAETRVKSNVKGKDNFAYCSVDDVTKPRKGRSNALLRNEMPSYFFAETLKYLYLLFLPTDPLPLDSWVFNTEAHPLPVFESQWST